ncbi:MAG: hypothetical protein AAF560_17660 [Acidobacteriota bacterium]
MLLLAALMLAPSAGAQNVDGKEMINPDGATVVVREALHGTAPMIDEIMENYPAPKAWGLPERAIVNPSISEPVMSDGRPKDVAVDQAARKFLPLKTPAVTLSFGGYDSSDNVSQGLGALFPPDTNGDVGIDFYVQYNNVGWKYFDKATGALVGGPFPGNSFWQGSTLPPTSPCVTDNAGDPIVLYDHVAGRWMFSQFVSPLTNNEGHQCFAITTGSNPAGPYFVYDFVIGPAPPNAEFNDYEKIALWTDGGAQSAYHMSSNQFPLPSLSGFLGVRVTAFERDAMLAGAPAQSVEFFKGLFTDPSAQGHVPFSFQPAHLEGPLPATGTCNYYTQLNDGTFTGLTGTEPDGFQFWEYCVDWTNPGSSTFIEGPFIPTTPFVVPTTTVPQPGTGVGLDVLAGRAMYRFSTRVIGGDLRGVISHDVDVAGTHSVRFAEFELPSLAGISLADQGTLTPPDAQSRWMPAAGIDEIGNIAIVYSRSGSGAGQFPSVYYTGRETIDPPGTLQTEEVCINGSGIQTGTQNGVGRWGDYASVSVDPVDGCTFWMTNEYVETTGSVDWDTQICAFRFPTCGAPPGCTVDADCDDGLFCNGAETCDTGTGICQAGTPVDCDDGVSCTNDSCNEGTDMCDNVADDSNCDDGLFCNGAETCDPVNDCQAGTNPCAPGQTCNEASDICVGGGVQPQIWMSFRSNTVVPGVGTVRDEDIVSYNEVSGLWSLEFDGSDVGLGSLEIDGMAIVPGTKNLLLSFTQPGTVGGIAVDDSDIVLFTSSSLGPTTAGTFSLYFDGSDVGLTGNGEDVDGIAVRGSRIMVSTNGTFTGTGASGRDEDLFLFTGTLGPTTSGSFSLVFDGSDVGLNNGGGEDIDAAAFTSSSELLLSTVGNFSVAGLSGPDEDVIQFTGSFGTTTSGTFSLRQDLTALGIDPSEDIGSLHILD